MPMLTEIRLSPAMVSVKRIGNGNGDFLPLAQTVSFYAVRRMFARVNTVNTALILYVPIAK